MALSTEEHDLLVSTCSNMNIAASTCREVLEMLRSLGSTGVVDIAEHNNASTPHANATNLVHIDSGKAVLGTKGLIESGKYPVEIAGKTGNHAGYGIDRKTQSLGSGNSSYTGVYDSIQLFANDSNGDLVTASNAASLLGQSTWLVYSLATSAKMYDGAAAASLRFLTCRNGETNPLGMRIMLQATNDNGVAGTAYTFQDDCFISSQASASLGRSGTPFATAYLVTAASVTSDRREKEDISPLQDSALAFVKALQPSAFRMKTGTETVLEADKDGNPVRTDVQPGIRTHWGFVAQEVKEAMTQAGIEDAACWCLADKEDPDSRQSLRYEELIAPLVKAVQVLAAKVEALEAR